ncbi:MAG: hypothetical protein J6M02_06955 [Clostridia bacterium]|nr:hypothetical protein [Clostridia bacterium]
MLSVRKGRGKIGRNRCRDSIYAVHEIGRNYCRGKNGILGKGFEIDGMV